MSDAKHTPDGDPSFLVSLGRHVAAGVGLVAVTALTFWGIGAWQSVDDGEGAAPAAQESPADSDTDLATPSPSGPDSPSETGSEETGGTETSADPTGTAAEPSSSASTPSGSEDETAAETESEAAPSATFAPAEVSIQVLDAVAAEDRTAQDVADRLAGDDYDVVAVNRAYREYEQTTVMFTPGHEDEARQVARAYGFPVVREAPDNLSNSVDIHVVVGIDQT